MAPVDNRSNGGADQRQLEMIRESVLRERAAHADQPLSVTILGLTGTGKSSLLNALFGTDLATGDVRPVTRVPEAIIVPAETGHPLTFWDMPGLGESPVDDEGYLDLYLDRLLYSDVVIWALHADQRAVTYEALCLDRLLRSVDAGIQGLLLGKLAFVLTKADLVTPPPWVYDLRGDTGTFAPPGPLERRLLAKAAYVEDVLLAPYGDLLTAETYNDSGFDVADERLSFDAYSVRYSGHVSQSVCDDYAARYPKHAEVFRRLRDNHRVLPCSSRLRYNLLPLLVVVVNKLGFGAVARFQRVLREVEQVGQVPVAEMRGYANLVVWDGDLGRKVFDLEDLPFGKRP